MPQLELYFLGPPRIERDGAPVRLDTRKAIALLAYLAVTDETQRRDALAALLWPDADQSRARAALRRTLSTVNTAFAGEGLSVGRETIGLDSGAGVLVDVARFRSLLAECGSHGHPATLVCDACLEPLTEAAKIYREDFLAGFTLRDSTGFDDWQLAQTESFRRELAGVLGRLVRCHAGRGEFEPAIVYGRRSLALDPMNESAHRQLMQVYSWAGQRTAALGQYRECVRVLDQELGVSPLDETTQLYQAIREDRAPPAPDPQDGPIAPAPRRGRTPTRTADSSALRSGYPLVGRSEEWRALVQAYSALGPDGHFVVVEGEAGIGKTRLADEFRAHVGREGATTIGARCFEGEANFAYGLFVEVLRAALGQRDPSDEVLGQIPGRRLGEAARLLPELAGIRPDLPAAPPLDSPGAQSRFFEAVSQVLLEICRGPAPGLLFLDDLHWADEASIDLLTYVVRRLRRRPICILVTWRGEGLGPEHRLRRLLGEAEQAGLATLLSLARLSRSAVAELAKVAPPMGSTYRWSRRNGCTLRQMGYPSFSSTTWRLSPTWTTVSTVDGQSPPVCAT